MNRSVLFNSLMNLVITIAFVLLNNWALQNNLEETFISLALLYGIAVIAVNAIFIFVLGKK